MTYSPLLTDLYQLTMMQGYLDNDMHETGVFEFFVRKMPKERNFLVAAGLEQVLDFLENVRFEGHDLDFLAGTGHFQQRFLDYLASFRFSGDVYAMPEGTLFFPDEPILRVAAPIAEAQLVETRVINILQFQSMIASKAARLTLAARPENLLVDFGLRRAHGAEAGLFAARASYLAGFSGSSTVLAGKLYGMPIFGTMAHSFIQAHDAETLAFEHFAHSQPQNVVLLIDTYDTEQGARKVVDLAPKLAASDIAIKAVRLDSGDMIRHSFAVRQILDAGGLHHVKIFTSGNLDEYKLAAFVAAKAPIDGFGVGTRLVTSADKPYLDCAYKLVEYEGVARRKKSEGKATWPGRKQVYRYYDQQGLMVRDVITVEDDFNLAQPLICQVMHGGKRSTDLPSLHSARKYALAVLDTLPSALRGLTQSEPYPVEISHALQILAAETDKRVSH
jgi:nicotinate phosphoribosyltransferase